MAPALIVMNAGSSFEKTELPSYPAAAAQLTGKTISSTQSSRSYVESLPFMIAAVSKCRQKAAMRRGPFNAGGWPYRGRRSPTVFTVLRGRPQVRVHPWPPSGNECLHDFDAIGSAGGDESVRIQGCAEPNAGQRKGGVTPPFP
jgi:hypothetical protein